MSFSFTLSKTGILIFHVFLITCHFIPSAGQIGTRAEVGENACPYFSFFMVSYLCGSDCSPRKFTPTRAVTFNLMSPQKM